MALCWPEQKVALEIVDDPAIPPFDRDANPEYTVIEVSCAQLEDPEASDVLARTLAHHLGAKLPPDNPRWHARRRSLHHELFGNSRMQNRRP